MLQWFITFPEFAEFTEFNESSALFRKNSDVDTYICHISQILCINLGQIISLYETDEFS